jgi:integrase
MPPTEPLDNLGGNELELVWRFDQAMAILQHMHPQYRTATELMLLTGISASEIAGLAAADVEGDYILIQTFIARKREKKHGKTKYRRRRIPITRSIRACLDKALAEPNGIRLFQTATGLPFQEGTFRQNYWIPALKKAGLPYKKPYSTRHTFAAWSMAVGVNPTKLVNLMGHGSKKMVFEVYGNYTEGLEEDREKILAFMGEDFLSKAKALTNK